MLVINFAVIFNLKTGAEFFSCIRYLGVNSFRQQLMYSLLRYKGKMADNIIKSMKKTIHELLPETVSTHVTYTGKKLSICF